VATVYTDFYSLSEIQSAVMVFIDGWIRENKTLIPRSIIVEEMETKGIGMSTTRNVLYSLIKKGYIRQSVQTTNKTLYVQLKSLQY